MIKVYVRAIVPHKESYLLMSEKDKDGNIIWDLPGGAILAGMDVKENLRSLVLQNTGYAITNLKFFEIVCRVLPRKRGTDPLTTFDFIFTSKVDEPGLKEPEKEIELLPFANFEWLESDGRFRENKVMALLGQYHRRHKALQESQPFTETTE